MEIKELRLHNLVKARLPEFTNFINPISINPPVMVQIYNGEVIIEPIRLTRDELLLLGFTETMPGIYSIPAIPGNEFSEELNVMFGQNILNDCPYMYLTQGKTGEESLVRIPYVHTLQNLVFALTAREITYPQYRDKN